MNSGEFQLVEPNIKLFDDLSVTGRHPGSVGGQINLNVTILRTKSDVYIREGFMFFLLVFWAF